MDAFISSNLRSTLRRRNLKAQQSPVILDLCLKKTWSGKSQDYRDAIVFKKLRFKNVFCSTLKRKAGVFKSFLFEERFRKAPFSWRIRVHGRPNRRNEAVFSHFSGVVSSVDGASGNFKPYNTDQLKAPVNESHKASSLVLERKW